MSIDLFFPLFLVGLLGSTHCLGMCGGLQQLFINMSPDNTRKTLVIYHVGRVTSYGLLTLIIATVLASFARQTQGLIPYATGIRIIAALLMIWIGVNHLITIPLPKQFRLATDQLWRSIRRIAQPFLPPKNRGQVFIVGMVWGWLPCSLVYSALAIALSADNALMSTLAMVSFGLGTMPALIGIGFFSHHLQKKPQTKYWLAALLIAMGLYALLMVFV